MGRLIAPRGLRTRALAAVAVVVVALACGLGGAPAAEARALVVMIGDSTMWGGTAPPPRTSVVQAATDPGRALAALLALLPDSSAWHDGEVVNLGVPGTNTLDWVERFPERLCADGKRGQSPRVLDPACDRRVPLAEAVAPALGRTPDAILVLLGTNDVLLKPPLDPAVTAANLDRLRELLPRAPIYIAPPLRPPVPPGSTFADGVRRHLLERGILNGPDWPPLPTIDGLHLTEGGYAAAAGLWLDVLRKQTP